MAEPQWLSPAARDQGRPNAASAYATVLVERRDAVAVLTLNRPERRNALSSQLITELRKVMADLAADPTVRAIVLTGAGTAFCAGLDLNELGSTGDNLRTVGVSVGESGPWQPHTTPVIGAVNGPTATGGLEVALHCDFLLASERAAFADTHARVGVLPGWGLSYLLPQAVGPRRAREMSLSGRMVAADEAYAWGLVNRVLEPADLLPSAIALAHQIAELDPAAAAAYLTLYRETAAVPLAEAPAVEARHSTRWADEHFSPEAVAARRDDVIARGRAAQMP